MDERTPSSSQDDAGEDDGEVIDVADLVPVVDAESPVPPDADPHASKVPPDAPGLNPPRPGGRFLRKGPITLIGAAGLAFAVIAAGQGLDAAPVGFNGAAAQPVEPSAPTSPNLEVSDLVKNAPGYNAPIPTPSPKMSPALASAPAPAGRGRDKLPPDVPDLSKPAPAAAGDVASAGAPSEPPAVPHPDPRRARLEARIAERARAMAAAGGGGPDEGPAMPGPQARGGIEAPSHGAASPFAAGLGSPAPGIPGARAVDPDSPGQAQKHAFLREGGHPQGDRPVGVGYQRPDQHRMRAGWVIPCALQTAINSDLPGIVVARVTQNVYDSVSGDHLLVPIGATVTGSTNSSVAYGQERAQVCWNLLERDDGVTVDLGCAPAYDRSGAAGLRDQVDNHYGRLITGVVLSALLSAGTQAVVGSMENYHPTVTQGFAIGAASEFGSVGQQITRRNLQVQPTLEIRNGWPAIILLDKPVVLPPYKTPLARSGG